MTDALERSLNELRNTLIQDSDNNGAQHVLDMITAIASANETFAAIERGDDEAILFHSKMLVEQTAGLKPLVFRVASGSALPPRRPASRASDDTANTVHLSDDL